MELRKTNEMWYEKQDEEKKKTFMRMVYKLCVIHGIDQKGVVEGMKLWLSQTYEKSTLGEKVENCVLLATKIYGNCDVKKLCASVLYLISAEDAGRRKPMDLLKELIDKLIEVDYGGLEKLLYDGYVSKRIYDKFKESNKKTGNERQDVWLNKQGGK